MAARGLPIVAPVSGRARISNNNLGGKVVHFTAQNGDYFYLAHLDSFGASGDVRAGTKLGTVGTSGNAALTPPHLHFEYHPGNKAPVNPYRLLRAACG